jgi:hypothetical protein
MGNEVVSVDNLKDEDFLIEPEDEIARLASMGDVSESEQAPEPKDDGDEAPAKGPDAEGSEDPQPDDGERPEIDAESTPAEAVDDTKSVLDELRAEKDRLREQLIRMEERAKLTDEQLAKLSEDRATQNQPQEEEEQGPTADEILAYVDDQIISLEEKIDQAKQEAPDQVRELRAQKRQLERYQDDFRAQQQELVMQQAQEASRVDPNEIAEEVQYKQRYDSTRDAIMREYPLLDKNNKDIYNQEMVDAVMEFYSPLVEKGNDPIESLAKATVMVMRANNVPSISEYMEREKAASSKKDGEKSEEQKPKSAGRKQEAVERNVKAAQDQPPNISGTGKPNDATVQYDFDKMSNQEFEQLMEKEDQILKALEMYNE